MMRRCVFMNEYSTVLASPWSFKVGDLPDATQQTGFVSVSPVLHRIH